MQISPPRHRGRHPKNKSSKRSSSVPLCLCASVSLCLCVSVPLCLCASVSLCLCVSVSLWWRNVSQKYVRSLRLLFPSFERSKWHCRQNCSDDVVGCPASFPVGS